MIQMAQCVEIGALLLHGLSKAGLNEITLNSTSWDDPDVIPPWAFKSSAEFERVNPLFSVPRFDNEVVLVLSLLLVLLKKFLPATPICLLRENLSSQKTQS